MCLLPGHEEVWRTTDEEAEVSLQSLSSAGESLFRETQNPHVSQHPHRGSSSVTSPQQHCVDMRVLKLHQNLYRHRLLLHRTVTT